MIMRCSVFQCHVLSFLTLLYRDDNVESFNFSNLIKHNLMPFQSKLTHMNSHLLFSWFQQLLQVCQLLSRHLSQCSQYITQVSYSHLVHTCSLILPCRHLPMSVASWCAVLGGRDGMCRISWEYVVIVPRATAPSHSSEGCGSPSSSLTCTLSAGNGSTPCCKAWLRAGLSCEVKGSNW